MSTERCRGMRMEATRAKIEFNIVDAAPMELSSGVVVVPTAVRLYYFYSSVFQHWGIRSVEVYQDSNVISANTNVELDEWYRVPGLCTPEWLKKLIVNSTPTVRVS